MKDNLESAIEDVNNMQEASVMAAAGMPYQGIELRLVDDEGNVLVKGGMKVADMIMLEQSAGGKVDKGSVLQMLYFALEDELEEKLATKNK